MNLAMKTNSIDQKKLRMFITSILRVGKKETSFAKNIHIFSNIWNIVSNCQNEKGLIQVLVSALEKHNYINLTFETNANNS